MRLWNYLNFGIVNVMKYMTSLHLKLNDSGWILMILKQWATIFQQIEKLQEMSFVKEYERLLMAQERKLFISKKTSSIRKPT